MASAPTYPLLRAVLGVLLLALAGCKSTSQFVGQHAIPAATYSADAAASGVAVTGAEVSYLLQAGDAIDVKFYFNPELNEQLLIGPDGRVAMQLIGEVKAAGLSTQQFSEEITRLYAATLRNPQATAILRKYALPRIYVAGEVNQPAAHALESGSRLTALQAIVQSGGFRIGAERGNVIVLRNSGSASPVFIKLDLQAYLEQTVQADILLRPYDIVYVPQTQIAEVAEFFEAYFNKIVPIYRNMGLSFNYDLRNKIQVQPVAP